MTTVSLVNLLDSLLHKAYQDLNILQELLRNKSDIDRKVEIVKYARRTRTLLIRLLALVKWAGNSSSVQKCSEMSVMLSQQSGLYVDTADQLVDLLRSKLISACTPNFSLAPALDILSLGTYPRLPTCIKDRIIPLPSLKPEEENEAHSLINSAIRHRLLGETIPEPMVVTSIGDGLIKFRVPYEFELTLSVVSDELSTPWRLISLKILVGEGLPEKPVLLHEHQKLYLHQLIQSRLYSEDKPLQDSYECIHSFCLSLQLDCLHSQANQLSCNVYGEYMKVEEYTPAHHLKIMYWRPGSSRLMSAFLLEKSRNSNWPKVLISIDPSQSLCPFSTYHYPPLPDGIKVSISASNLSLEALLKECIQVRSHTLLKNIQAVLDGSSWENVELQESPMCLRIKIPLKYGSRDLVLGVDPRVGNIVASVDPPCSVGRVVACLEELEKVVSSNSSTLPTQLTKLQCHLFVGQISEIAEELDLPTHWSLPLVKPLPFHASALLFLQLQPLTYLVVSVGEGLVDQYHLLSVSPVSLNSSLTHQPPDVPLPPKSFLALSSLVELDLEDLRLQHLRSVTVRRGGPALKRKISESGLELPCLKRICIYPSPDFAPLPSLITARMVLLSMETSLKVAGISHHTLYTDHGSPSANIFNFPNESCDMHKFLSSSLKSCQVSHSNSGYTATFIFTPPELGGHTGGTQGDVILRQFVGSDGDLGQNLLGQWQARVALLGLTLELQQYIDDAHWPLHMLCVISEFTYDQLSVVFGKHLLYVKATPTGLVLSLSPECPHSLIQKSLETFLRDVQSIPLLLQGMCATDNSMSVLAGFKEKMPPVMVSASAPSEVQLSYDNFSLSFSLQANSSVAFTDIKYSKPVVPTLQTNPLHYLQGFLHSTLSSAGTDSDESSEEHASHSMANPQKVPLYSTPSPISFPRRTSWPDSVPSPHGFNIPSIPPFSTPDISSRMGQSSGWNFQVTLEQFNQLLSDTPSQPVKNELCVVGCSLLKSFLGSLSLFFNAIQYATKFQLQFVQCDRGVYTYRTDNLAITLAMEGGVLHATLRAVRENVWSSGEVEALTELFKREVVTPPFSLAALQSFFTLLVIPLPTFKGCVQLLQHQQNPTGSLVWNISLCLTIPPETNTDATPFSKGSVAVNYRARLLLFLRLERIQDRKLCILPVMYEPKTNVTFVPRYPQYYQSPLYPAADAVLKKVSSDMNSSGQSGHPPTSCSLFPAIQVMTQSTLNS